MQCRLLTHGILLLISGNVYAEWLLDTSVALQYNDNLANASLDQDIKRDTSFEFSLIPAYHAQLSGYTGLTLAADLDVIKQLDYSGLDHFSTGVKADIRRKFGLGRLAPWASIGAAVRYLDYDDGQRDGWTYSFSINAGKLLTDRFTLQGGYRYERRRTDQSLDIPDLVKAFGIGGEAFDTDGHHLEITGLYQINERLSLVLGYTFRTGTITSTTLRNNEIFEASDAIAADPVYGPDRFAYRITADTNIYSAGLSLAINNRMSFNVSYAYQNSDAYEDLAYNNNLVRVDLLYNF